MRVHDDVLAVAGREPDRVALRCGTQRWTYSGLAGHMERLATAMAPSLTPGDRVAMLVSDKSWFLAAFYATALAGAVAVPLTEGAAPRTLDEILDHCEPSLILTTGRDLARYRDVVSRRRIPTLELEDLGAGAGPGPSALPVGPSVPAGPGDFRGDDAPCAILYTSGTTSKRKGVVLSHRNLVQAVRNINEFMQIEPTICEALTTPLSHSFGLARARCVLSVGGSLVLRNGSFNPAALLHDVKEHSCNAISWVPAGFALSHARFAAELRELGRGIRWMELGSAPMPIEHKQALVEIFPRARICMHYGLTEASRSTFLEFRSEGHKLETVGRPSPHVRISIIDDEGRELPAPETGEICIRGAHVARGYWRDQALDARSYTQSGLLRTGDYGCLDPEGYLRLIGRKDDMINMGGIKISPAEVEEAIRRVAPQLDFCVVGVPDPEGTAGTIPALCYAAGVDPEISLAGLHRDLAPHLDRTKLPRLVFRLAEIPRTANGKIRRQEVLARIMAGPV